LSTKLNILSVEDLASEDEVRKILDLVTSIDSWENAGSDFWDNRALNIKTIRDGYSEDVADIIYSISLRIQEEIKSWYGLDNVYPDLLQIIRWFPGMSQPAHADDMTDVGGADLSAFHHRDYGAIIYLNDDYTGGHTFYPQHNIEIIPKSGKLAVHPGTPEYMHGVTEISGGIRYTIASFWTKNKEKSLVWPVYE
jgi:hypothetical protein